MNDFRRPLTCAFIGALILGVLGCGFTLMVRNVTSAFGGVGGLADVRGEMVMKALQFGLLGALTGLLYAATTPAAASSPSEDAAGETLSKDKLDRIVQRQMREAFGDAPPPSNTGKPADSSAPPTNVER